MKILNILQVIKAVPPSIKFAIGGTIVVVAEYFLKPLGNIGALLINLLVKALETIQLLPGAEEAAQMALLL